jgi:glycosyltransferase involved in cell wall biosynthesis
VISIVTISMNQGRFLPAAVNSVLSQRDVDLEYVIVDAGSTDGSREYLATLSDPRVRLVLEPDRGPADGLNKGVRSTTGAVVGYLNADDLYLAGTLRRVDEFLRGKSSVDVLYGDGWIIDGEDRVSRHFESTRWGMRAYLYGGVSVLQPSTFFRRSAFDRTTGFNPCNATSWDSELLVDMALAGARFHHMRADWSAFRLHAGGISGSRRLEEQYREDCLRVREEAIGRELGVVDACLRPVFRTLKLLRSPGYMIRRLGSRPRTECWIGLGPGGYDMRVDATTP